MRKRVLSSLIIMVMGSSLSWAAPRSHQQMRELAARAIAELRGSHGAKVQAADYNVRQLRTLSSCSVIGVEGGAFAVISSDDAMPAVVGISDTGISGVRNMEFEWWLQAIDNSLRQMQRQGIPAKSVVAADMGFPEAVEPLVTTRWGQEEPFNSLCPVDSDGTHCLTGCVATSTAQVLNYFKYPLRGRGSKTVYYPFEDTSGTRLHANFAEVWFDWDHMRDVFSKQQYTDQEAHAVAELMVHAGISANMMYGTYAEGGSGASSVEACDNLKRYFGCKEAVYLSRDKYEEEAWMRQVFEQLSQYGPIVYNGDDQRGGHSFVVDGYNANGLVHVNWGYEGVGDGYYNITLLNPSFSTGGYQQSQDMMIIRVDDSERITSLDLSDMTLTDGRLPEKACYGYPFLTEVKLPTGITSWGDGALGGCPSLRTIHLPEAEGRDFVIVDGSMVCNSDVTELIAVLSTATGRLTVPPTVTTIHANAFDACVGIDTLDLPASVTKIGNEALLGCAGIDQLRCRAKTPPTLTGHDTFKGIFFNYCHLNIPSGTKAAYQRKAQWKDFTEVDEFGTTIKANNQVRKQGEPNPTFSYTMQGAPVAGTPQLYSDADIYSPPGVYTIFVEPGTITDPDVEYVNGRLIVEAAATGIHATSDRQQDATRHDSGAPSAVYSPAGLRLSPDHSTTDQLPRGVYIIGNRKVVVP